MKKISGIVLISFFVGIFFCASVVLFLAREVGVLAKDAARKISGFLYHEAEEYNPPGDVVPDSLDDRVKDSIRSIVE